MATVQHTTNNNSYQLGSQMKLAMVKIIISILSHIEEMLIMAKDKTRWHNST